MQQTAKSTKKTLGQIEQVLSERYGSDAVKAYQYNSASIRVRIISNRFKGLGRADREKLVNPLLRKLPEDIQSDIVFLLLLTPDEVASSQMNAEFENPTPSRL